MSIDRGDSHWGDAKSWEKACRHIGLFLWWAAERGLASELHDAEKMRSAPTQWFIRQCDTKLTNEDLSDDGNAFAKAVYEDYLLEVDRYSKKLKVGVYEIPEGASTTEHFFQYLDARLKKWQPAMKKGQKLDDDDD